MRLLCDAAGVVTETIAMVKAGCNWKLKLSCGLVSLLLVGGMAYPSAAVACSKPHRVGDADKAEYVTSLLRSGTAVPVTPQEFNDQASFSNLKVYFKPRAEGVTIETGNVFSIEEFENARGYLLIDYNFAGRFDTLPTIERDLRLYFLSMMQAITVSWVEMDVVIYDELGTAIHTERAKLQAGQGQVEFCGLALGDVTGISRITARPVAYHLEYAETRTLPPL